jgi:hypothetical protein
MIGSFLADWPTRYPGRLQPSIADMLPRVNGRQTRDVLHPTMTPQAGCRLTQDG